MKRIFLAICLVVLAAVTMAADTVLVSVITCGGSDKISAISALGVATCTADSGGDPTLAGDVDGLGSANDLDEVNVETELESVLDLDQLQGTLSDSKLGSNYSGVGACGVDTFASTLNDNAAPTCTQPAFSNLSGAATDGQIPNTITIDLAATANAGDSATAFFSAGTIEDARIDGSTEADELTLVGDVDGLANANDLDETAVETELEGVLDLVDLQGTLTDAKLASNYSGVGACAANTWASTLNDNAAPTCTQPATTNISNMLVGSASLNFADPAANTCTAAQTITVTGADTGDAVILGVPAVTIAQNQFFPSAWVSAANTVSIKFCEETAVTSDPAAGTFTVIVID